MREMTTIGIGSREAAEGLRLGFAAMAGPMQFAREEYILGRIELDEFERRIEKLLLAAAPR